MEVEPFNQSTGTDAPFALHIDKPSCGIDEIPIAPAVVPPVNLVCASDASHDFRIAFTIFPAVKVICHPSIAVKVILVLLSCLTLPLRVPQYCCFAS